MKNKQIKNVWFKDKNNKWTQIKRGDIVIGYTGILKDVYKATDEQVKKGKMKVGEPKPRPTLILDILTKHKIIVIFASHSGNKIFIGQNKNHDSAYQFRSNLIQIVNLDKKNKLLNKVWEHKQLINPKSVVQEIIISQQYQNFLKKNSIIKATEFNQQKTQKEMTRKSESKDDSELEI